LPFKHGVVWTLSGETPPLLDRARYAARRGWLAAAEKELQTQGLGERALMSRLNGVRTERLGDWHFLVEPEHEGAALLLGDTWGAHMAALSRVVREVAVFEQDPAAAQYLRVRAEQAKLANVSAIVGGGGVEDLPFTRGQFSLVALVGPWSASAREGEALDRLIQASFRLLRKGGSLMMGLPNALRIPFARRGAGRNTVASTIFGFRNRLARAGFQDLRFYLPSPDLADYQGLVSLDSHEALRYFHATYRHPRARWKRVLLGAAIDVGLIPVVAPSYIATARKP
jgi:SAM-dependent methyltransferase